MPEDLPQLSGKPLWNSLEVAKIAVAALTPLMLLFLGHQFSENSRRQTLEASRTAQVRSEQSAQFAKLVEKRLELWDKLAIPLNDTYVYLVQVGHWKQLSERDVISRKRQTDALIYANRPFFSDRFFNAYNGFIDTAFEPYQGIGEDAKLRTSAELQGGGSKSRFTGEDNREAIHNAYFQMLSIVAQELNLNIQKPPLPKSETEAGADVEPKADPPPTEW